MRSCRNNGGFYFKITGKKFAALGLAITGYFVSIPVFCDSAFVILSPLARELSIETNTSMTTMAVALTMGLHATHIIGDISSRPFGTGTFLAIIDFIGTPIVAFSIGVFLALLTYLDI